jgi:predicted  nucleic acid-binding Zn-ribbon protein
MSFVAITYGYNQYSIFNTNTTTQPLIDSIATTCLNEINTSVENKKASLSKEITRLDSETHGMKKEFNNLEKEKQKEEERVMEMSKQIESPKKGVKVNGILC